jgi:hypothetical protein
VTNPEAILLASLGKEAAAAWEHAAKQGIGHILLVKKNNPAQPTNKTMARADVIQAMDHASITASLLAQEQITKTWTAAGGDLDSPYLAKLLKHSTNNGTNFGKQAKKILKSKDMSSIKQLVAAHALRQAAGQAVADTRAKAEASLHVGIALGHTIATWAATGPNPCENCLALSGTSVPIGTEFPHDLGPRQLAVYGDLTCPPRHVACACTLLTS